MTWYLLKVTNIVGAVYKMSSLAEEGMNTGGNDNCPNFTLFAGGARENSITRVPCDWQGFTSESCLVNFERISFQETGISRDNISQLDANHISRYQNWSILFSPFSIPQHLQNVAKFFLLANECVWSRAYSNPINMENWSEWTNVLLPWFWVQDQPSKQLQHCQHCFPQRNWWLSWR